MPLSPSDYKNIKLDPTTRAQLFQLFIEGKFAEYEATLKVHQETLKALRNDMNAEWGERRRQLANTTKELEEVWHALESLKTENKLPEPKKFNFWPF